MLMDNPDRSPESSPGATVETGYHSLPLTVSRHSGLDRAYPFLLGTWAVLMALLNGMYFSLPGLMVSAFFIGLVWASVGIRRQNPTAVTIATVQLAVVVMLEGIIVGWILLFVENPTDSEPNAPTVLGVITAHIILYILPALMFLWLIRRQRFE